MVAGSWGSLSGKDFILPSCCTDWGCWISVGLGWNEINMTECTALAYQYRRMEPCQNVNDKFNRVLTEEHPNRLVWTTSCSNVALCATALKTKQTPEIHTFKSRRKCKHGLYPKCIKRRRGEYITQVVYVWGKKCLAQCWQLLVTRGACRCPVRLHLNRPATVGLIAAIHCRASLTEAE